jgi:hypothetical protein
MPCTARYVAADPPADPFRRQEVLFPLHYFSILAEGSKGSRYREEMRFRPLICAVMLVVATFAGLRYITGSPINVYPFIRHALPNWHRGDLRVGDTARDSQLFSLDGKSTFHLRDRICKKPLVLNFGSYT